jgi:hypothetical protein
MSDVRNVVTISIFAALGAAVIFNAAQVTPLLTEVRRGWVQIVQSISGVNR